MRDIKQYSHLKLEIEKDEYFLIREGLRIAKQKGLEIRIGDKIFTSNNRQGILNLPFNEDGADVRQLIALASEEHPEIFDRYVNNSDLLSAPYYTS